MSPLTGLQHLCCCHPCWSGVEWEWRGLHSAESSRTELLRRLHPERHHLSTVSSGVSNTSLFFHRVTFLGGWFTFFSTDMMGTTLCHTLLQMGVSYIYHPFNKSLSKHFFYQITFDISAGFVCLFPIHWLHWFETLSFRAEVFRARLVWVWRFLLQTFWRQKDLARFPEDLQGDGCWTRFHPLHDGAELAGKLPVHGYVSRRNRK